MVFFMIFYRCFLHILLVGNPCYFVSPKNFDLEIWEFRIFFDILCSYYASWESLLKSLKNCCSMFVCTYHYWLYNDIVHHKMPSTNFPAPKDSALGFVSLRKSYWAMIVMSWQHCQCHPRMWCRRMRQCHRHHPLADRKAQPLFLCGFCCFVVLMNYYKKSNF